jgi:hypothetical protein
MLANYEDMIMIDKTKEEKMKSQNFGWVLYSAVHLLFWWLSAFWCLYYVYNHSIFKIKGK